MGRHQDPTIGQLPHRLICAIAVPVAATVASALAAVSTISGEVLRPVASLKNLLLQSGERVTAISY